LNSLVEAAAALDALTSQVKAGCTYQKTQLLAPDWKLLKATLGFDLNGYTVVADTHAMQHTLKKHGTNAEALRGQKEIERTDFQKLPLLLTMPDAMLALGVNRIGRECVGFEGDLDGYRFRAVMEIRSGRFELALVSLYTVKKITSDGCVLTEVPFP
jgi:hypothetical protein